MKQQHVIFDLDGTLIESEQIWRDVRREFVIEHGGRWHDGAQTTMMGMRTGEWSRYIHDELRVSLTPDEIAQRVVDGVVEAISKAVPVLPGADDALRRLANHFRLGLATSATQAVAETVLAKTGWQKYFAAVASADAVARGKPAPDVYLRVLDLLEADAQQTVAVEDSTNGIRSADAAQLAVIAIPNRTFPPDPQAVARATFVLSSLDDLRSGTVRDALQKRVSLRRR
jgi:HAD superfamily hydrolase (TIGR01509 family)